MSNPRDTPSTYRSYLLRLWRTQSAGAPVWRAALEEPLTQEVIRFESLPDLFAFLLAQLGPDGRNDQPTRPIPRSGP